MSLKFTAPSSCFALPFRPTDSPTYGYGIVMKGLFKSAFREQEVSRWRSVPYPWTN